MTIETERLTLRPLQQADWPDLLEYAALPQTVEFLEYDAQDAEGVRGFIARNQGREPGEADGEYVVFAVVEKASGKMIGDVGIKVNSLENREVGYTLNPAFQGRGYATEAARAMLELGLGRLGLHRVVAVCDAGNRGSIKLMTRLGMRQEAHFNKKARLKGEWRDELVYAILADEFAASRGSGAKKADG